MSGLVFIRLLKILIVDFRAAFIVESVAKHNAGWLNPLFFLENYFSFRHLEQIKISYQNFD